MTFTRARAYILTHESPLDFDICRYIASEEVSYVTIELSKWKKMLEFGSTGIEPEVRKAAKANRERNAAQRVLVRSDTGRRTQLLG